jgi:hypothetical protein
MILKQNCYFLKFSMQENNYLEGSISICPGIALI